MLVGAFSLVYAMATVGIRHEGKLLALLDQFVDQHFCVGIVDIIITSAMDVQ